MTPDERRRADQRPAELVPDPREEAFPETDREHDRRTTPAAMSETTIAPLGIPVVRGVVVTGDSGAPVSGALVVVRSFDRGDRSRAEAGSLAGVPLADGKSGDDGTFEIELPVPRTELRVAVHAVAASALSSTVATPWVAVGAEPGEPCELRLGSGVSQRGVWSPGDLAIDDPEFRPALTPVAAIAGAAPVSRLEELARGGFYPAYTADPALGVSRIPLERDASFEVPGLEPGGLYLLRSYHLRMDLDPMQPIDPLGPDVQVRAHVPRQLLFLLGEEGHEPGRWNVEFDLELLGSGGDLPLRVRSTQGGIRGSGRAIDLSLLPEALGAAVDPAAITGIEGSVRARLDPYSGGRRDSAVVLVFEGSVRANGAHPEWWIALEPEQFRPAAGQPQLELLRAVDQHGRPLDVPWVLDWVATDGKLVTLGLQTAPEVWRAVPDTPCRVRTHAVWGERVGPTWEAGWIDRELVLSGGRTVLVPLPGRLDLSSEDPERLVRLSWTDHDGLDRVVHEGRAASLFGEVELPTGSWVLADVEAGTRQAFEVEAGRTVELTLDG